MHGIKYKIKNLDYINTADKNPSSAAAKRGNLLFEDVKNLLEKREYFTSTKFLKPEQWNDTKIYKVRYYIGPDYFAVFNRGYERSASHDPAKLSNLEIIIVSMSRDRIDILEKHVDSLISKYSSSEDKHTLFCDKRKENVEYPIIPFASPQL